MSGEVATKIASLKASGVATDIPGLEALLRQKTTVATEIAAVERRAQELKQCREQREELRVSLRTIRQDMTARRKAQLGAINTNLRATIKDYAIFVHYTLWDNRGIREVSTGKDARNLSSGQFNTDFVQSYYAFGPRGLGAGP